MTKKFSRSVMAVSAVVLTLGLAGGALAKDLSARTQQNLQAAMHGEAYANLKYRAYAEIARDGGNAELAKLFEEAANVEANEHFAREADALGLAKTNEANLLDAMAGEHYENTKMYKQFAQQAREDGDKATARLFDQIAADEGDHYEAYKAAFDHLKAQVN